MANRPEYIQLDPSDDAASVRDRLSFFRGQRVLLIWPEEGSALTRKLDLVLIQREAMRRAIRLAIVTHDPVVIEHAAELNISTFETIGSSERGRWKRGRAKVFTSRFQRPQDAPEPEELMDVASRVRGESGSQASRWRFLTRLLILVLAFGLLLGIGYIVVPSAVVAITPAQNHLDVEVEISADPTLTTVDVENRLIPATRLSVQVEDTGTLETTGAEDLGDTLAAGSIVFINQTDQPITIPAGTTVTTSAGTPVQFRTTREVELAAGIGLQIEVPIEALPTSQGEIGNVASGQINTVIGPLANSITARNIAPTTGGARQIRRTVTASDQERLLATLRQQLQARAYVEMEPRLQDTQFVILETVHIAEERDDWKTFSAQPGTPADTLSLTMRAVVEAIAVDEAFGRQIVYAQMSGKVAAGQFIKPETVTYERGGVRRIDPQTGRITFVLRGAGLVTEQINAEALTGRLAGLSINDATAYLMNEIALEAGTAPQISLTPDWLERLPILPMRITLQIQEPAA